MEPYKNITTLMHHADSDHTGQNPSWSFITVDNYYDPKFILDDSSVFFFLVCLEGLSPIGE
uniref:Uncharacterized protein n=1 Tax=Rhizophora mucronata TaxID=61149 RepID=A0A2P2PZ76_RHIMU